MAAYKITYFNITALGEPLRFLFSYGGIPFEDVRVERDDWPALKPTMPFGQMPVMEHNGKVINQSAALARYIAKQVGLVGDNDWDNLEIDAVVDNITDLRAKIALYHYEADAAVKESRKEPLFKEHLPFYLERFNKGAKGGYLTLGRLTWADLFFVSLLGYFNGMAGQDIIADYPNLVAVKNNVMALPNIKAWMAKRPKTEI